MFYYGNFKSVQKQTKSYKTNFYVLITQLQQPSTQSCFILCTIIFPPVLPSFMILMCFCNMIHSLKVLAFSYFIQDFYIYIMETGLHFFSCTVHIRCWYTAYTSLIQWVAFPLILFLYIAYHILLLLWSECLSPQNEYVETLTPNVTVLAGHWD